MAHPKHQEHITRQELDKQKYVSMVEEFRRHIRHHRTIKVTYKQKETLFEHLIITLRTLYQAPNKDFSKIGTHLMIDKYRYEIIDYQVGDVLELETIAKGQLYNIKYKIKKSLRGYRIHYYDYSKAQQTIWGLKANITKFFYKKAVKNNAKMIKKSLQKLKGTLN